jgi:hypothetical protein
MSAWRLISMHIAKMLQKALFLRKFLVGTFFTFPWFRIFFVMDDQVLEFILGVWGCFLMFKVVFSVVFEEIFSLLKNTFADTLMRILIAASLFNHCVNLRLHYPRSFRWRLS